MKRVKVVILQEYVPGYRVPFFENLRDLGEQDQVEIVVAAGAPGPSQRTRSDAVGLHFQETVKQREFRLAGRRIVLRRTARHIAGADLVVTEQARRNLDSYRLLLPNGNRATRIALWGHGRDYTRESSALERAINRKLTARAHWFFAYTSQGAASVKESGFPVERTTVVQNSIDSAGLKDDINSLTSCELLQFTERHGLKGRTAIFLGGLDESKRLGFLLLAAEIASGRDANFRLLICGDGDQRALVEDAAAKHHWLTYLGPVVGREKALALAAADVIAMPGRVGLIAVDSFASERPLVTTNWTWHAPEFEYLRDRVNAVVANDNVESYASALLAVLADSKLRERLVDGCISSASSITIETMAQNFMTGIHQAIKAGPR